MNKTALKNFAIWARRELLSRVVERAKLMGIEDGKDPRTMPDDGHGNFIFGNRETASLSDRKNLIDEIDVKGYKSVMEEAAYTWFNRFVAIKYMEANGYLTNGTGGENICIIGSRTAGKNEPDFITDALKLKGIDKNKVYELKDQNNTKALYRYLFMHQCTELGRILPYMFTSVAKYTELLLPDNLYGKGEILYRLNNDIDIVDFTSGQVEIIGWLYQYYISEKKDEVFKALASNIKITKENIPAATQLFTPDWIVRYLVENSLARIYIDHLKSRREEYAPLLQEWKYYLNDDATSVAMPLNMQELKFLDPSCGSGHILVYAFDVLYKIYEWLGFASNQIPRLIIENNLYGLDIDLRAAQLSYFALMMKGRSRDRNFFDYSAELAVNVEAIVDCPQELFYGQNIELVKTFKDAGTYGSILKMDDNNLDLYTMGDWLKMLKSTGALDIESMIVAKYLPKILKVANILSGKYDVVCTNPPYMGASGMTAKLAEYCKNFYPDSKSDLCTVFIEQCGGLAKQNGYIAMITMHSWMFLSSFEKLRKKLIAQKEIVNMAHLGARAFEEIGGEVVQTTAFVMRKK